MNIKTLISNSSITESKNISDNCIINDYDYDLSLDISLNNDNKYVYNLNQNILFEFNDSDILYTTINSDKMTWPELSYKLYQTTHLYWLLMDLNNISMNKSMLFYVPNASTTIKYLNKDRLVDVINYLNDIE